MYLPPQFLDEDFVGFELNHGFFWFEIVRPQVKYLSDIVILKPPFLFSFPYLIFRLMGIYFGNTCLLGPK